MPAPAPGNSKNAEETLDASITSDPEVSDLSGPLDASIGNVADIPLMPVVSSSTPFELDASIGDVDDVPAIVSPAVHQPQPSEVDVSEELEASIGEVDDMPSTAYAPPPRKPHPPRPHTLPIGPEQPHPHPHPHPHPLPPRPTPPIRPVGPEKPHEPRIHPVGPEAPHSGEGGSIEPVGPERPARPHIQPVGPEQPHEPASPESEPELSIGGGGFLRAGGFFRASPFRSLFSSLFGDLNSDLNDPPSMRFRFSPDETETTTTQLPGGGVLVVRRFHHEEPQNTDPAALDGLGPRSLLFPPSPLDDFATPEPPPPFGPFGFFRRFFGPPPPPPSPMPMQMQQDEDDAAFRQLRQQEHIRMRFPDAQTEPESPPLDASITSDPAPVPEEAPHHGGCRHKKRHGGLRGFFKRVKSFFGGKHHKKHDHHELSPEVEADPAVIAARSALRTFRSGARKARKQYKRQLKRSFRGSKKERKELMRQFRAEQKAEKRRLKAKLREAIDAAVAASSPSSAPADTDSEADASDSGFITPEMADETSSADASSEELHGAIVEAEDINAPAADAPNAESVPASVSRPRFSSASGIYDRDLQSTDASAPAEEPRHHHRGGIGGWFHRHKVAAAIAIAIGGVMLLAALAFLVAALNRSRRAAAAKTAQQPSVQMGVPHTPVAVAYAILPAGDEAVRIEMQQPQQPMVTAQ